MNFFGMGPTEFLVIAVIAFIIFGPEKFSEVAGSAGKFIREVRSMSGGITGEFQQAMNEFQQVGGEIRQVTDEIQDSTRSLLTASDPRTVTPRSISNTSPAPAFVRGSSSVGSRPTKADPLADFSGFAEASPVTPPKISTSEEAAAPQSNEPAA